LIFGVDDLHRQLFLANLRLAELERFFFLLLLADEHPRREVKLDNFELGT
jgi:hypothetical protein